MRFGSDDDADSSQIEDRRGSSFGGPMMIGGGGLGIVGVVAYVLIRLLGGDVQVCAGSGEPPAPAAAAPENHQLGGSCQGVPSAPAHRRKAQTRKIAVSGNKPPPPDTARFVILSAAKNPSVHPRHGFRVHGFFAALRIIETLFRKQIG